MFLWKWRMNRRQYINIAIILWLVNIVLTLGVGAIKGADWIIFSGIWMIQYIVVSVFWIWSAIRRAHDFWMPTHISLIAWLLFLITGLITLDDQFATSPIFSVFDILAIVWWLIFIFYPGTQKPNQYWEQPKNLKKVSEIIKFWWTGQETTLNTNSPAL